MPPLHDSRNLTDYRPNCVMVNELKRNNNITSDAKFRQFLQTHSSIPKSKSKTNPARIPKKEGFMGTVMGFFKN